MEDSAFGASFIVWDFQIALCPEPKSPGLQLVYGIQRGYSIQNPCRSTESGAVRGVFRILGFALPLAVDSLPTQRSDSPRHRACRIEQLTVRRLAFLEPLPRFTASGSGFLTAASRRRRNGECHGCVRYCDASPPSTNGRFTTWSPARRLTSPRRVATPGTSKNSARSCSSGADGAVSGFPHRASPSAQTSSTIGCHSVFEQQNRRPASSTTVSVMRVGAVSVLGLLRGVGCEPGGLASGASPEPLSGLPDKAASRGPVQAVSEYISAQQVFRHVPQDQVAK